jgi:putative ABC transport system permease protein
MRQIALASLLHDKPKAVSAAAGVAFATALVLAQAGVYVGFLHAASGVIARVGGNAWVMARGVQVLDYGEAISGGAYVVARGQRCVARVRPLVFDWSVARTPSGNLQPVLVVGYDREPEHEVPWTYARGLPLDLAMPMRVGLDEGDIAKFGLSSGAIDSQLELGRESVRVAAVTAGIRSFTLAPYIFASAATARTILGMPDGRVNYLVVDLMDPSCVSSFVAAINGNPELQALSTTDFRQTTERYWVDGSGAGAAIEFSALLALVVGSVIVSQTLYSITKDYQLELATLKAIGASATELLGFVCWQAAFLAVVGGAAGTLITVLLQDGLSAQGVEVALTPTVLAFAGAGVVAMCLAASMASILRVLKLDAVEVFR